MAYLTGSDEHSLESSKLFFLLILFWIVSGWKNVVWLASTPASQHFVAEEKTTYCMYVQEVMAHFI